MLKYIIEALLFVSDKPLGKKEICEVLQEFKEEEISNALEELIKEYENRGIRIFEVANGYRMQTNPELADYLIRLKKVQPLRLSPSVMETLAIIAYKQPITKAEIETIRGANSQNAIKTLLEKGLIKIAGKKDVPGRPLLYGTTRYFLELFSLKDISSLPDLKDFEEMEIPLFKRGGLN